MATSRVLNLTTKCYLKIRQAEGRIEHCVSEWVVQGKSIRDLTLAQMVQKRSEVARTQESLAHAEIPGFRFEAPTSGLMATRKGYNLVTQTHFMNAALHEEKCECSDCKRLKAKINDLQFCIKLPANRLAAQHG